MRSGGSWKRISTNKLCRSDTIDPSSSCCRTIFAALFFSNLTYLYIMTSALLPPWCVGVSQWMLIQITTGLVAGYTPASSKFRPAAAVGTVALACSFQLGQCRYFNDIRISGPLAGVCWANVFNAIDVLLLSRINYRTQVEWDMKKEGNDVRAQKRALSSPFFKKLRWSLALPFNYRRIGTLWQIRNIPTFDGNGQFSSRLVFLARCALKLLLSVLVLVFVIIEPEIPGVGTMVSMISDEQPSLIPSLTELSQRETFARLSFVVSYGIMTRASLIATYYSVAIVFVALCISEPVAWPPVTGLITEARSLKHFWRYATIL